MNPYQYINNLKKYGKEGGFKPGLERIRALLAAFDNPQDELAVIHVAGSNGKGSTIAFLKSIYQEAGYKVGSYISPHIVTFNERMEINGDYISTPELSRLVEMIAPVVEEISRDREIGEPTFFEVLTAMALLYFSQADLDLVLLEVGLGGRFDATNIIRIPLASLITSISLEHTVILGDRIEDIAREKAGIIKTGRPVFTGVWDKRALRVINEIARERSAGVMVLDNRYSYEIKDSSLRGQRFILSDKQRNELQDFFISLAGEHQVRNAILALDTIKNLAEIFPVSEEAVSRGFKRAFIPGRLEIVREEPLVILDGAHNLEGMEILVDFMKKHISPDQRVSIIISILEDKDVRGMLKLLNFNDNIELILTQNKNDRSLDPYILKEFADSIGIKNRVYPRLAEAVEKTIDSARDEDIICITGSLYTVLDAKKIFNSL